MRIMLCFLLWFLIIIFILECFLRKLFFNERKLKMKEIVLEKQKDGTFTEKQPTDKEEKKSEGGCGCCSCLMIFMFIAFCLSYRLNHDILYAIVHGFFNILYVIYKVIFDWKEVITIFQ